MHLQRSSRLVTVEPDWCNDIKILVEDVARRTLRCDCDWHRTWICSAYWADMVEPWLQQRNACAFARVRRARTPNHSARLQAEAAMLALAKYMARYDMRTYVWQGQRYDWRTKTKRDRLWIALDCRVIWGVTTDSCNSWNSLSQSWMCGN